MLGDGVERVRVIDLAGRVVRTLQGSSSLVWDGRDDHGRAMANGVYWIRAEGGRARPCGWCACASREDSAGEKTPPTRC